MKQNAKLIIIGCNTASSISANQLREKCDCPVIDVIEPAAIKAVNVSESKRIGVIGTPGTIASGSYANCISSIDPEIELFSKACPLFVPLVEEGILEGEIVDLAIDRYLSSMRQSGIDTLVLGCTHYPLLKESISSYFGSNVRVVDSGEEAANAALIELERLGMLCSSVDSKDSSVDSFFVTETTEHFEKIAAPFLGKDAINAIRVHNL